MAEERPGTRPPPRARATATPFAPYGAAARRKRRSFSLARQPTRRALSPAPARRLAYSPRAAQADIPDVSLSSRGADREERLSLRRATDPLTREASRGLARRAGIRRVLPERRRRGALEEASRFYPSREFVRSRARGRGRASSHLETGRAAFPSLLARGARRRAGGDLRHPSDSRALACHGGKGRPLWNSLPGFSFAPKRSRLFPRALVAVWLFGGIGPGASPMGAFYRWPVNAPFKAFAFFSIDYKRLYET
jgi:hypothetical protein